MTQPRAKRIRPVVKHRRPERGAARNVRPTPERVEWVRNEIRRRLGIPVEAPAPTEAEPTQDHRMKSPAKSENRPSSRTTISAAPPLPLSNCTSVTPPEAT
jgi:hypothetical protein